jgi:hypothetical protein
LVFLGLRCPISDKPCHFGQAATREAGRTLPALLCLLRCRCRPRA